MLGYKKQKMSFFSIYTGGKKLSLFRFNVYNTQSEEDLKKIYDSVFKEVIVLED